MPPATHSEVPTMRPPAVPPTAIPDAPPRLEVGDAVEVRSRFDRHWSRGFAVADVDDDACLLRRTSDGSTLPVWFPVSELRPATTR